MGQIGSADAQELTEVTAKEVTATSPLEVDEDKFTTEERQQLLDDLGLFRDAVLEVSERMAHPMSKAATVQMAEMLNMEYIAMKADLEDPEDN